jgi:hypothetical protein
MHTLRQGQTPHRKDLLCPPHHAHAASSLALPHLPSHRVLAVSTLCSHMYIHVHTLSRALSIVPFTCLARLSSAAPHSGNPAPRTTYMRVASLTAVKEPNNRAMSGQTVSVKVPKGIHAGQQFVSVLSHPVLPHLPIYNRSLLPTHPPPQSPSLALSCSRPHTPTSLLSSILTSFPPPRSPDPSKSSSYSPTLALLVFLATPQPPPTDGPARRGQFGAAPDHRPRRQRPRGNAQDNDSPQHRYGRVSL